MSASEFCTYLVEIGLADGTALVPGDDATDARAFWFVGAGDHNGAALSCRDAASFDRAVKSAREHRPRGHLFEAPRRLLFVRLPPETPNALASKVRAALREYDAQGEAS